MNRRLFAYIALFTLFACCVFVSYNPNIATDYTGEFSDGEAFTPEDSHFNLKDFELNCTGAKNFTARTVLSGHTQFIDDTGDRVINYLELDRMIQLLKEDLKTVFAMALVIVLTQTLFFMAYSYFTFLVRMSRKRQK